MKTNKYTLQSVHACLCRTRSGVMRRDVGHTPKMEVFCVLEVEGRVV